MLAGIQLAGLGALRDIMAITSQFLAVVNELLSSLSRVQQTSIWRE